MTAARLEKLEGKIVLPGEPLATIEEFLPEEGVYVDNGIIRAAIYGKVKIDIRNKRIRVEPLKAVLKVPRRGEVYYGFVSGIIREDLALIKLVFDVQMERLSGTFTGVLHLSQASDRRIESVYQVIRLGDFVRVQVVNEHPLLLSIKQPQLGVVTAFCSNCGAVLYRKPGIDHLVCKRCGNRELRKVSTYYMFVDRG